MKRNGICRPTSSRRSVTSCFGHGCAAVACSLMWLFVGTAVGQVAPQDAEAGVVADTTMAAYDIAGRDAGDVAKTLQTRFAGHADVRIVRDPRTNRILVRAPAQVHRQLERELIKPVTPLQSPATVSSGRLPGASDSIPKKSLNWSHRDWSHRERRELVDKLQYISWRQLVSAAKSMSAGQLVLAPNDRGNEMIATLPSRQGETTLRIDTRTGEFRLEGTPQLTAAWLRAIRVLDRRSTTEATQLVPIREVSPQSINRAVNLLQSAQDAGKAPAPRWGADVVGIAQARRADKRPPVQIAQAPAQPPAESPANDVQPNGLPADPQPLQPERDSAVGVDGSLIGPVQIEYVEGLDAIIIRGRKADVDRVMRIIDDIERLSLDTEPAIELVPLQHVNSQSMSELVSELNAEALAVRIGNISITPLVKPNALLLIGRREGVKATLELIRRLDQPVAPTSQFSIFRLKHLPATDAVTTIESFFADRGGLGPRIQLQADFRTNSIIVYASPRDMDEVRRLLQEIDVADNAATSEVRVFKLNNALAEELAPVLEATLRGEPDSSGQAGQGQSGTQMSPRSSTLTLTRIDTEGKRVLKSGILTEVRVAADVRANSLVITAPAESMELIAALVKQLDELPTADAVIKVFTIVNGDALTLTAVLDELFGVQQQGGQQQGPATSATGAGESSLVPLRFSTDPRTNSIIATGASEDLEVVEAILLRLDEDDVSQRQSQIYRLQNAPAADVALAINEFLRTERQITLDLAPDAVSPFEQIEREVVVVPEVVSNSLIISATPRYFKQIVKLVEELDERPPMVLIQVLIASVRLDNLSELGVELGLQDSLLFDRSALASADGLIDDILDPGYNFNNRSLGNSASPRSLFSREKVAGQGLTSLALGRTNSDLGYGGLVLSASSESVNILIRALQQSRRLDILSRPQIMTLNNQPAFVQVGQQVPIVQSTAQTNFGQTNSVTLTNVGILLGVTPRISPDGLVVMEIDAEKSELSGQGVPISISAAGDVLEQPIIDTTRAQTTVSARSGQTVILGGLITKSHATETSSVPYLGDIPVIGNLFRFDSVSEVRTELLIIMTPYIVRKAEDADMLNQIEAERMSWCLADVIDVHGDTGFGSGGVVGPQLPTRVIYPDRTPTSDERLPLESSEEIPSAPVPQPRFDLPLESSHLRSNPTRADSLPTELPQTTRIRTGTLDANQASVQPTKRRWRDRLPFGRGRDETPESTSDSGGSAVSRVQFLRPRTKQSPSTPDRYRLPSTD